MNLDLSGSSELVKGNPGFGRTIIPKVGNENGPQKRAVDAPAAEASDFQHEESVDGGQEAFPNHVAEGTSKTPHSNCRMVSSVWSSSGLIRECRQS